MIGKINKSNKSVTIIGCGITGLLAGYLFKKNGYTVKIYEKADKAGGIINTIRTEYGYYELAAHIIKNNNILQSILSDLNVEHSKITVKKKQILVNTKLKTLPITFIQALEAFLRSVFLPKKAYYKSLEHFTKYHFGKSVCKNFFTAITHGIYATKPSLLNSKVMFKNYQNSKTKIPLLLYVIKQKLTTRTKKQDTILVTNGISNLINALANHLKDSITYNFQSTKEQILTLFANQENVIIATDAKQAEELLSIKLGVEYLPITHLWAFFDREKIESLGVKKSIGFLSSNEDDTLLGCLFNGFYDTYQQNFVATAIFDGSKAKNLTEGQLLDLLKSVYFKDQNPIYTSTKHTKYAIPLYSNDLFYNLQNISKADLFAKNNLMLCGNYCGALSVSQIAEELSKIFD